MFQKISYYLSTSLSLLSNVKRLTFSENFLRVTLKDNSIFFTRNIMDLWIIAESYLNRDYEKNGQEIGPNWQIIDIGAAFGDFSIFAAKRQKNIRVIAVEPLPNSQLLLQKNIKVNGLTNIIIHSGALYSKKQFLHITENNKNFGNSSTLSSSPKGIKVPAITLSDLFKKYKIKHCHLIKSDCEGAEYDIFLNTDSNIYKKIDRIVMEYHLFSRNSSKKLKSLTKLLNHQGFNVNLTPNPVHSQLGFLYAHKN